MSDSKLTALTALSPILSTDLLYAVSDPSGSPASKKVTVSTLFTAPTITGGLTASGSAANTFAGSSGTFVTSTGAVTIGPGAVGVTGIPTFTPPVRTSGVAPYFTINQPADTTLTASTEAIGFSVVGATRQWATGALTEQREIVAGAPTYGFVGASTVTRAVNLYAASPIQGTNATLSSSYAALFEASAAAHIPLAVRMASSVTGDAFRVLTSANATLVKIISTGAVQGPALSAAPTYSFTAATGTGIGSDATSLFLISTGATTALLLGGNTGILQLGSGGRFTWASTSDPNAAVADSGLGRASGGIVEANNGTLGSGGAMLIRGAGATHGEALTINSQSELLTLSTSGLTTDTSANLLPANALILAVTCRVTTTITTTTNWAVGDGTTSARFSSANSTLTSGTTSVGLNHLQGGIATDAAGPVQVSAAKIRITCTGSNPGAGAIRITCHYLNLTAATS